MLRRGPRQLFPALPFYCLAEWPRHDLSEGSRIVRELAGISLRRRVCCARSDFSLPISASTRSITSSRNCLRLAIFRRVPSTLTRERREVQVGSHARTYGTRHAATYKPIRRGNARKTISQKAVAALLLDTLPYLGKQQGARCNYDKDAKFLQSSSWVSPEHWHF